MKRIAQIAILLAVSAAPAFAGTPPPVVTPEPASIALIAAGLAAVGAGAMWRSRRNKK
ncbi:MAG: PEP-CTERM sorting domain-containing protein [Gemmatimonadaceae bacterium]